MSKNNYNSIGYIANEKKDKELIFINNVKNIENLEDLDMDNNVIKIFNRGEFIVDFLNINFEEDKQLNNFLSKFPDDLKKAFTKNYNLKEMKLFYTAFKSFVIFTFSYKAYLKNYIEQYQEFMLKGMRKRIHSGCKK